MRVLLVNPEMPTSFWSFPEICRLEGTKTYHPPLGLITVAALLPREWELRVVDLDIRELRGEDWDWADLVMLTGMLVQRASFWAVLREARDRGKIVVAGGPYATAMPEEVLANGGLFLVRGEAENIMPQLLAALQAGRVEGVFESREKPVLTTSPIPRFDLLNLADYSGMSIQTSRGCPYDCEFCDVVSLYGRRPRYKTAGQVLAELAALYRLGWRKSIFICDDNFISNKTHAQTILQQLIPWMQAHGEPFYFWTQTSIDLGHDLQMIDLMTQANFSTVFTGIETPDEELLLQNRKLHNIRHPLMASLRTINANGLAVLGSFILGFDGEKAGAGRRIRAFVESADLPLVMLNLLQPLPHTRLWERLKREGRLHEPPQGKTSQTGDVTWDRPAFRTSRPEAEILAEYIQLWEDLYEPTAFLARAYRYFLAMRPTRQAQAKRRGGSTPLATNQKKVAVTNRLVDFYRLCWLVWRQGVKPPHRRQFWRQLLAMQRRNPSRLVKYLTCCVMGEDMFRLRRQIREKLAGPG